ncbi:SGNH/GDSL hydrolase family protein [Mangrovibacterium sp.]|uniref:SGNH/GDSL hydrolase family protein n=1 Tax=Mangrovibacterium sp. TaxID=1961364 RepID=UPI003561A4F3
MRVEDKDSFLFRALKSELAKYDSTAVLVDFATPGDADPGASVNQAFYATSAGTMVGWKDKDNADIIIPTNYWQCYIKKNSNGYTVEPLDVNLNALSNTRNQFKNPRLFLTDQSDFGFTFFNQTGTPSFTVEENEFFGNHLKIVTPIGARGQVKADITIVAGSKYSCGFFYKVINSDKTPTIYGTDYFTGGKLLDGTLKSRNISDGWVFVSREGMEATVSETLSDSFIIDFRNDLSSTQQCTVLIAMPTFVVGSAISEFIDQRSDFGIKNLGARIKVIEGKVDVFTTDFVGDLTSTVTTVEPICTLKAGKKYTIYASSEDDLTSGLFFYRLSPSTVVIQEYPSETDFSTGVFFEFTPEIDLTLYWRVYIVGKKASFNVTHYEKIGDVSASLRSDLTQAQTQINAISKSGKLHELLNYTSTKTTTFNKVDVDGLQGVIVSIYFKAQYTGTFTLYGFRANGTYYSLQAYASTDFSSGITFSVEIPSDVVQLQIRTHVIGVIINEFSVTTQIIRKALFPVIPTSLLELSNDWTDLEAAFYGDSITALLGGDYTKPYTDLTKWSTIIGNYFQMGVVRGRGIGGQKYAWGTNGGSVAFLETATGIYNSRNDSYNYDNYAGNVSVPSGTTPVRGAFSSWLRITTSFPAPIKANIRIIVIKGGTNDAIDGTDLSWVGSDATDPEWAASEYYSDYGGDYNISTLKGGIASTIMKMQAWMPQAVIVIATPLSGRGSTSAKVFIPDVDEFQKSVFIRENAKLFSLPIIDINAECGINGLNGDVYISDGIHPTEEGQAMMARVCIGTIKTILPKET